MMARAYSRIVVTSGVSMFNVANTYRKWAEDEGLLVFPKSGPNPVPPGDKTEQQTLEAWQRRCGVPGAGGPPEADPARVSAEYSVLSALRGQGRLTDRPHVVLIHTASLGGAAAARMLGVLLKRDLDATVACSEIRVDVTDRGALRYDLGNFMQTVASHLRDYDRGTTCFAPLGGYKVMTSLGYLAGAYMRVPTLYMHEDSQIVHEIPAVPVGISRTDLARVAPLMKRVGSGCKISDLNTDDRELLTESSWLFEYAEGMASVNAFGLFLMQEAENAALFAPKLFVSEAVDKALRANGRLKFVLQQLIVLAGKLAASSPEPDMKHEIKWKLSSPNRHLYSGASNGVLCFRCIYRYDSEGLRVYFAWTDHARYEEELANAWSKDIPAAIDWSNRMVSAP